MPENISYLSGRKGLDNNLFERLNEAGQIAEGTPENKELKKIAEEFLIGDAITLGSSSFYDFLKEENEGKKVYVCSGSACLVAGTQDKLKTKLKKHFKEEEIGKMCCLGRCHENAAFSYKNSNYSSLSDKELSTVIEANNSQEDQYRVTSLFEPAILTADSNNVDEYYSVLSKVLQRDSEEVLNEIKDAILRGRGGAGFPMGQKLGFCRQAKGGQKYIVCNADEGDPGAYSDRYLLEKQPHSVLFGMIIAGYVTGADTGVLYIRAEYPESIDIVKEAIAELQEKSLIGTNILGSGFDYKFKVIKAAGAYICGEETALLNSIEGQRPEVRVRPPFPAVEGLFGKPTVVNNVETFSNLNYIMEHSGKKYAEIGTEKSKGTKLISLDSFFYKPGIYEVAMGTAFKTVIHDLGGGFKEPVKALQVGGPLGGIVPLDIAETLSIDFESFHDKGFLLGHASVVSIPESFPMIEYLKHLFEFAADESCGKCFPCRLGSTRGHELIEKATEENLKIDRQLFDDLMETLEMGSLCALGGLIPLPAKNALQYFSDELKPYFSNSGEAK